MGNGHRLLVVEDEPDCREGLRLLLELKGYAVETAENGLHALEIVKKRKPPCLVLLDLNMPLMTGWEFCAELRKHERLVNLPVVILSAIAKTEYAHIPCAVAQISKPVDMSTLYRVVAEHC